MARPTQASAAAPPAPPSAPSAAPHRESLEDRAFFELAAVGATQVDVATRRFLRVNPRFVQMVGYSEAELRGMTFLDLTEPEELERNVRVFEEALANGASSFTIEKRLRRKDGSSFWAIVTVGLVRDAHGRPLRTAAIVEDITARKAAEAALRESERQMKLVLETAPVSILSLDRELRVRFANRVFLQHVAEPGRIVGLPLSKVIGERNFARFAGPLARALAGEEVEFEATLTHPRLGRRDVHVRCSPERAAEGTVRGVVAAIEDVTERLSAQAAFRAGENRLAAIFASAAAGLAEISLDGRLERVNDELCRMLGRPPETLLGLSVLEVTHPDDRVASVRAIGELVRDNGRIALDKRFVRPDGEVVWASAMLTRLDDEEGRARSILVVTIDLTGRRAAERRLAESEAKFRALAEGSPAIIWLTGPDGAIRYVNRRYLEFCGQVELPPSARPPVHPAELAAYDRELAAGVRERRALSVRARWRRHDGAWRWIESQALPHFDRDGNYLGHVGHGLDLTDLLESDAALRRSEDRLRRAIAIETVGAAFFDLGGRITQTNQAFLQMTGFAAADLAHGRVHLHELTPPEFRATVTRALEELASAGRTSPYEMEALRKDGSRWWGLFAATRLSPEEGVQFVIDISERKRSEDELRGYKEELEERVLHRTAELDALNGTLREEIKERTRAEQSRQELLRQLVSAQEDERRRISRELHDQVGQDITALMLGLKALGSDPFSPPLAELRRLQSLTEGIGKQIHDMALEIRPTALDDLGLVRMLANYVDEWSKDAGIAVDFHSCGWKEERLPSLVETTLYRIIREALNNILRHAGATHVSLIVERQPGQAVAIVEDDGRGFDPDALPNRGFRLGLLGMRERAALAGGEVSLESSPGRGTTVFVRIPLPPAS